MQEIKNQGFCNKTYITSINDKRVVVKELLNKETDKELEFKIQNLAYKKGIAPKAIKLDNSKMISEFIDGVHIRNLSKKESYTLAKALQKLHKIKVRSKRVNLKKLLSYKYHYLINETKHFTPTLTITHNDLNHKNVIFTNNSVKFIDFEYASKGDIYFDLASILIEFKLNERYFLNIYFNNKAYDLKKINLYKKIYKEVVKEWFKNHNIKIGGAEGTRTPVQE